MAEQPPWRAIQPPKLPRFTGEADGCDADEFIQEAERILRNFRMEEGTAVEWLIQALEGSAWREVLTRAAGEADTAAKVLAVLAATFGDHRGLSALLTSFHGRRQGMGESVVGYAQHLLMLTTKLNAAQAYAVNPAMLCDRFIDGLHPPSLRRDIRRYAREHDDVTFHQARAEAQRWMREDADVEVRAEQVLVAQPQHSKELEELRAQVAALTAKTAELQAELQHQSTRAPRPKVCYWCEQPGHFQQDCVERRQYAQRQQGPRASFKPSRPQPRFYAPRHSAGPRFPSHQGN